MFLIYDIILNHEFWKVSLDKKFEVLSDKQYFGRIESCILRNKDGQKTKDADQPTLRPDLEKRKDLEKFIQKRNARSKNTIKGNIKHKNYDLKRLLSLGLLTLEMKIGFISSDS